MQSHILSLQIPSAPWGSKHLFSKCRHVAYQIKGTEV